jgi:FkbM family methyltransferase
MPRDVPLSLSIKSALVASPLEAPAQALRDFLQIPGRKRHPELAELHLEPKRLPMVLRKLLWHDSNVVDVGCHIGSFLSLAQSIAYKGKHIAFEASPAKAALLARKFTNAEIIARGVSDHDGYASFVEDAGKSGTSHLGDGGTRIEVCTLDTALVGRKVDLLKLDIEGHELAALRGAGRLLGQRVPTLFECGPTSITPHREELYDLLVSRGYDVMTFADYLHNRGPMQYDEFRRCGIYPFRAMNYLAISSEPPK